MFREIKIENINDYLKKLREREKEGVYFYRISSYDSEIEKILVKILEKVKKSGVYIKDGLKNPTQNNISYFIEQIGEKFILEEEFIEEKLKKWIPTLDINSIKIFTKLIYKALLDLNNEGKNESILKNIYMKFMCWSYYKFQFVIKNCFDIKREEVPKILYEGDITKYELIFLKILSQLGSDILIIQKTENRELEKIIPIISVKNGKKFSEGFSIENIENLILNLKKKKKWVEGNILNTILLPLAERKNLSDDCLNIFGKIQGIDDKNSYLIRLLKFKSKLEEQDRAYVLVENEIPKPEYQEVEKIIRSNEISKENEIIALSKNIFFPQNLELNKILQKEYVAILFENQEKNNQKLLNKAIILLCWINRYLKELIKKSNDKYSYLFIFYGVCKNENEHLFLKLLSRVGVDVLVITPNKSQDIELKDDFLVEEIYSDSIEIDKFPKHLNEIELRTLASNSERELEKILYQDTGLYKNNQYNKATSIILKTTYEEINILWGEKARYREGFEILSNQVIIPTICAKITGVPNKNISNYWKEIEKYLKEEGKIFIDEPLYTSNNFQGLIDSYLKNGEILSEKIKTAKEYRYGFLMEEKQNYILEKIKLFIERRLIKEISNQDLNNKILKILLNLDIEILRLIQNYDFTKKIPKLIVINTKESIGTIEDAIIVGFLKEIGFDILLIVPTGYKNIESYYKSNFFIEHQIGEFMYELKPPKYNKETKRFNLNLSRFDFKSIFKI